MNQTSHTLQKWDDFLCFVFRNLRKTESRKNKLEEQLNSVGAKVNELKEKYVITFNLSVSYVSEKLWLLIF